MAVEVDVVSEIYEDMYRDTAAPVLGSLSPNYF
jgi:flagellar motility protein MotE (MotC chaperone)